MLYQFEDYALDTDRRELRRNGSLVSIEPRVFDLLAHVIENRARVVSRDDLLASVWDGRVVSESAQTTCINAARRAIADSGEAAAPDQDAAPQGHPFRGSVRVEQGPVETAAAMPAVVAEAGSRHFRTSRQSLFCPSPT